MWSKVRKKDAKRIQMNRRKDKLELRSWTVVRRKEEGCKRTLIETRLIKKTSSDASIMSTNKNGRGVEKGKERSASNKEK